MIEKVRSILAEHTGVDSEDVTMDASFKNDLGLDSLDLFELLMCLEDEYGILIDPEAMNGLTSVGDVVRYLEECIETKE